MGVFIGFRKVVDAVDHEVLPNKLWGLAVMDGEHDWFRNYLQNRTQIVEFQGVPSAVEHVSTGVPRGLILGPLLFILHLNNLPSAVVERSFSHVRPTIPSYFSQLLNYLLSRLP